MNFGNFFRTTSNKTVTLPTFKQDENHDSVDLQIKSLLYIFKRLRINRLAPFLNQNNTLRYIDDSNLSHDKEIRAYFQKLDTMYNVEEFQNILTNDEYRVLIDFSKNKFRSYCILSEYPSSSISRPSSPIKGEPAADVDQFPDFFDYKDRKVKNYRFSILSLKSITINSIAEILTFSDIYEEHLIDQSIRYNYAMDSIKAVIDDSRIQNTIRPIDITENEKALIIQKYLQIVAFSIQLHRIYEEYIKKYPIIKGPSGKPILKTSKSITDMNNSFNNELMKLKSSSPSKMSSLSSSSQSKKLSQKKSSPDLRSFHNSSPSKTLKSKPSISRIQLEKIYNPVTSPAHNTQVPSSKAKMLSVLELSNDEEYKKNIYDKCKLAVQTKIDMERAILFS